jgi:hypothetical protein
MIADTGRDGAFTAHDFKSVYTPSSDYTGLRSKLIKGMRDDCLKAMDAAGVDKGRARSALQDERVAQGLTGRGKTAWTSYQERIDHLARAARPGRDAI